MARVFIRIAVFEDIGEATIPETFISDLDIEKISETADGAEVTAEYDIGHPTEAHVKAKFTLEKRNNQWLISHMEPLNFTGGERPVMVFVLDEAKNPVVGAKVTISNAEEGIIRTEITTDKGLAMFGYVPAPRDIVASKEGYLRWTPKFGQVAKRESRS